MFWIFMLDCQEGFVQGVKKYNKENYIKSWVRQNVKSFSVFVLQSPSPTEFRHELELATMAVSNYSWHLGSALIFKRLWVMSRAYRTPRPHDHITILSDIAESLARTSPGLAGPNKMYGGKLGALFHQDGCGGELMELTSRLKHFCLSNIHFKALVVLKSD